MFIVWTVSRLKPNPVRGDMSLLTELNRGLGRADYKHVAPLEPMNNFFRHALTLMLLLGRDGSPQT
jgi:hypothetical protein